MTEQERPALHDQRRRRPRRHASADPSHLRVERASCAPSAPRGTRASTRRLTSQRLRLIQRLTTELGLNLAGVETVIRLEDELSKARARLERLERELRRGDPRCAQAVQA